MGESPSKEFDEFKNELTKATQELIQYNRKCKNDMIKWMFIYYLTQFIAFVCLLKYFSN